MDKTTEQLILDTLKRLESKVDTMSAENHTRFGNMELRVAMLEGNQSNRNSTASRIWTIVGMVFTPVLGAIVWLIATVSAHGYAILDIDNNGTKFSKKFSDEERKLLSQIETRIMKLESKK